jgi:predicted dehydrogenase
VSAVARTFERQRYLRDQAGALIQTVKANVDDTYMATAGFENGSIGQLLWSWAGHGAALSIPDAPAFYGSEGCLQGDRLITDSGKQTSLLANFDANLSQRQREEFFPLGLTDPYAIQQWDWLQAIRQGRDPETSGVEGLHDLACAFAMLESSAVRRQVTLQEVLSGAVNTYQQEIDAHYGLVQP